MEPAVLTLAQLQDWEGVTRSPGCAYYPAGVPGEVVEAWVGPADVAWRGRTAAAEPMLTRYVEDAEEQRILPASAWGISSADPEIVGAELRRLYAAVQAEGWDWAPTASSLAGRLHKELTEPADPGRLAPRWWRLADQAIHQGPIAQLRGGGDRVEHWDRRAAFLRGLSTPMPRRAGWSAVPAEELGDTAWLWEEGLVSGIVWVDPRRVGLGLGPLPHRVGPRTVYPTGYVAGAWTIAALRAAMESGAVKIEHITEVAVATIDAEAPAWLAPLADRIDTVKDKGLRKLLYTRAWGRFAAKGGFQSVGHWTISADGVEVLSAENSARARLKNSALPWEWSGVDSETGSSAPHYRPDLAAFVASDNLCAMIRATAACPQGALMAAHVDSIWVDRDVAGDWRPPEGEGWELRGAGRWRGYRPGVYTHHLDDGRVRIAAMGWPHAGQPPESEAELLAWLRPGGTVAVRRWTREWRRVGLEADPEGSQEPIRVPYDGHEETFMELADVATELRVEVPAIERAAPVEVDVAAGPDGIPAEATPDGRRWVGDAARSADAWSAPARHPEPAEGWVPGLPSIYARRWTRGGWPAGCSCETASAKEERLGELLKRALADDDGPAADELMGKLEALAAERPLRCRRHAEPQEPWLRPWSGWA